MPFMTTLPGIRSALDLVAAAQESEPTSSAKRELLSAAPRLEIHWLLGWPRPVEDKTAPG